MQKLVSVVGTTASGKSDLGIVLAQTFGGEIVSCDSRQIFKGLDLGTGKVTKEEQQMAVHHLLDIKNPNDYFSAKEYQNLAYNAINDILARGKRPFLVGGTGLYSRAVCEGFNMGEEEVDEELRNRIARPWSRNSRWCFSTSFSKTARKSHKRHRSKGKPAFI